MPEFQKQVIAATVIFAAIGVLSFTFFALANAATVYTVVQGGTGSSTLSGLLKGNAKNPIQTAVAGTDYVAPSALSSYLTLSAWYATTTNQLTEGANHLYYTDTRARAALTATYPLQYNNGTGVFSVAYGTTTSNTWAGTQTFNNITVTGTCTGCGSGGITALGNYASTTATAVSLSTSTASFNGLTFGQTIVAGTSNLQFTPTISGTLSNSGLANSTISGVALGGTLFAHTHDSTLPGSSYTGTAAVSNWGIDLSHGNTWTGLQAFTNASSSQFEATSTVWLDNTKSALLVTDSAGKVGTYGGAGACSANNFVTTISALGATTCGTASISGVNLGGTLAALTATNGTLTFSGSYDGTTARTIGLNVGNANTWTALQQFNANASTTQFSSYNKSYFGATATSSFDSAGVLTLITPLAISSGGTFASSFGTTNGLDAYDGTRLTNYSGYTLTSSLLTLGNGTSTNLSVSQNAALNGTITITPSQPATSTSMTLNWATAAPQVEYQIGGSATTITLINATTAPQWGSRKVVWICNPASGTAGAITWAGVEWIGTTPVQTTTANQCDVYSFDITRATSTSAYKVAGTAGTAFQ
jgi:hypothetical protein